MERFHFSESSAVERDTPARHVLLQAALSHLELALANVSAQVQFLQSEDRSIIRNAAVQLDEFARGSSAQFEESSREVLDAECAPLIGIKAFAEEPRVWAPMPELSSTTDGQSSSREEASATVAADVLQVNNDKVDDPVASQKVANSDSNDNQKHEEKKSESRLQDWLARLMDIFDQLDTNQSGSLELGEFKRAGDATGLTQSQEQAVFKVIDTNRDGAIDRMEWMHMLEQVQRGESSELTNKFCQGLAEMQAKNGRIYLRPSPQRNRCLLRPEHAFRVAWDVYIMVLLLYISLALPYSLGFGQNRSPELDRLDEAIDVCFFIDILMNFRTGYYAGDLLVLDSKKIAKNYLSTWFVLDFVTCFPLEGVSAGLVPDLQPAKLMKVGKVVKVIKLLRLGKLRNVFKDSELFEAIEDRMMSTSHQTIIKVIGLLCFLLLMCHWVACFAPLCGDQWAATGQSGTLSYINAMYWAMMTFTTVGYGDVVPLDDAEKWYAFGAMAIGGSFYGFLIGKISATIAARDLNAAAYTERMEAVRSWLEYHEELPKQLRRRIKKHFQKHLVQKACTDDITIINDLSPALVHDVAFFLVQEEVRCNLLFHNLPNSALAVLMPILERKEAEPEERLVSHGDVGTYMYIITSGTARFEHGHQWKPHDADSDDEAPWKGEKAKEEDHGALNPGESFGEEIILGLEDSYHYTLISNTQMQMLAVSTEAFEHAFHFMPDIKQRMHDNFLSNRQPSKKRKEVKGRASLKEGAIPTAFPDAVLDALQELTKHQTKIEARLGTNPRESKRFEAPPPEEDETSKEDDDDHEDESSKEAPPDEEEFGDATCSPSGDLHEL